MVLLAGGALRIVTTDFGVSSAPRTAGSGCAAIVYAVALLAWPDVMMRVSIGVLAAGLAAATVFAVGHFAPRLRRARARARYAVT